MYCFLFVDLFFKGGGGEERRMDERRLVISPTFFFEIIEILKWRGTITLFIQRHLLNTP